jgi:hypothetical protein
MGGATGEEEFMMGLSKKELVVALLVDISCHHGHCCVTLARHCTLGHRFQKPEA